MPSHRERVVLELESSNLSEGLAAAFAASKALRVDLALQAATWEPHDWADFA